MKHVTTSLAPTPSNITLPRVHPLDITSLNVPSEPTDTIHTLPSSLYLSHHNEDFLILRDSNLTLFSSLSLTTFTFHRLKKTKVSFLSPFSFNLALLSVLFIRRLASQLLLIVDFSKSRGLRLTHVNVFLGFV
ncbi:hypothetical protein ACSQ67_005980 [Phaseolus vulgaris]